MATGFTIDSVTFPNPPAAAVHMTFEYKLWSEPDSAYVLIDDDVLVDTDGTVLNSPLPSVTGLSPDDLYNLRQSSNCASPADYFVTNIQL